MILSKYWKLWIGLIILTYFFAVGVDTMDQDASQYASMSREMMESGQYLQVYEQGQDYLDKPPFLFWVNAASMKLFGENNFAFKFPSILFAILAVFCTYKLTRIYHEEEIARISAFILAACQALFLITNDIRTDTILMGWVALSLWLLTKWYKDGNIKYFLCGCAAIGGGMMTKGPIALLVPVFSLGSQLLLQRRWNYLFRKEYILGIIIILLMLIPMCIGLYLQFDLHPEKIMYGRQGTSGMRFFFWTQSFGRITGESVWDNGAPFSFLFENLLWGFLPWTFLMIGGLIAGLIYLIKSKFKLNAGQEGLTIAGFTITYASLSSSNYQLPHYIYVVLPLLAIITAKFIFKIFTEKNKLRSYFCVLQYFILILLSIFPAVILIYVFPTKSILIWLLAIIPAFAVLIYLIKFKTETYKLMSASVLMIVLVNIFISLWFYPQLLTYQSGNLAGRKVDALKVSKDAFYTYNYPGSTRNIHFYSKRIVTTIEQPFSMDTDIYVLTGAEGLSIIQQQKNAFEVILKGEDFPVSQLTAEFLNVKTRSKTTTPYYFVKIKPFRSSFNLNLKS
jgi:4-amino-4-deoxy-L-arabinose transferase-like glycosyltransferase